MQEQNFAYAAGETNGAIISMPMPIIDEPKIPSAELSPEELDELRVITVAEDFKDTPFRLSAEYDVHLQPYRRYHMQFTPITTF